MKITKKNFKFKFLDRRKGDVGYAVADNSKIRKYLKFKPKFNKISFIISTALKWEKKIKKLNI